MARAGRRTTGGSRSHTKAQSRFARIPGVKIPRSVFNRSHGHKTTFMSGYLVPIFVDEVLPGDTFSMRANIFARMATPLFPVMDNFYLDTFFFFVPNRLVWVNWQAFNGEETTPQGGQGTQYQIPQITVQPTACSIYDYFGWPTGTGGTKQGNVLPLRGYNLIFNEWFRDENLVTPLIVETDDGPDSPGDYTLVRRGKRHDYFSSALPFPQKGPDVQIPLGSTAPITGSQPVVPDLLGGGVPTFQQPGGLSQSALTTQVGDPDNVIVQGGNPTANQALEWDQTRLHTDFDVAGTAVVDLTQATATTINQMRELFQWQRMYERDARGGSRYTEIIRSHFGVVSPDARLQRPEYLGGSSTRINVNPVATTTEGPEPDTPPPPGTSDQPGTGDLSAFVNVFAVSGFMKSFTEHGYVIGLANVRADLTYQQGLERMWSRLDRFDFYWPSLAHLGEQPILNKEIFCSGTPGVDDLTFGYQERYAEYRYKPSRTSGLMRSGNDSGTDLDVWHLGLDFTTTPVLNQSFIEDNPPFQRVIRVTGEQEFLMDAYFQYRCARPMPTYSVPGLIDHF